MNQTFIYGTGNAGKIQFMREVFAPLNLRIMGIGDFSLSLPEVDESGNSPLENARIKALAYFKVLNEQTDLNYPVFSCDSGLYIEGLPDYEQPGVHVRRIGGQNLTDEEMVTYYASLAERLGGMAKVRYRNAICLVVNANDIYEYMGDDIAGAQFWLASRPHPKRESGFPLNSLSVHIDSGKYYNDLEINPRNNSQEGFRTFFRYVLAQNGMIHHYDSLIDENNDPVHDPEPLREYMNKWDGQAFLDEMQLSPEKAVLEIGIGTGRLAVKVAPNCREFYGISPKTVQRAKENLRAYDHVSLICGDFLNYPFYRTFDVIYSSLTFLHIKDKRAAIRKTADLLNPGGLFVLSVSKSQDKVLECNDRKIEIYPDTKEQIFSLLASADLTMEKQFETEFALIFTSRRGGSI